MHKAVCILMVLCAFRATIAQEIVRLEYAPSPADNPLRGLVPYAEKRRDSFPHSMEFNYVAFADLMKGYEEFDWKPLETLLDDIASRGHQAVVRIYLEYPGKLNMIPQFLRDDGLKIHRYLNTNTQPLPPDEVETPDYESPLLRRALRNFIREFGKKYDGDPRLAYITAGLLGTWGEWHTYPRDELFASKKVQSEVMDAYEAAFKKTPVLLRYPAGKNAWGKAANDTRPFGYHDDSFAWATLDTGKEEDDWFYMALLKKAGPKAMNKWRSHPIGGEIRPEAWGIVFDVDPGNPQVQNFVRCVEETHVTWLMDTGMFSKRSKKDRWDRAIEQIRRMGYEFHVPSVAIEQANQGLLEIQLEIVNRGVAPFYVDWPIEFGILDRQGKFARTYRGSFTLQNIFPDETPQVWNERFDLSGLAQGKHKLLMRVVHPLPNGIPLRFANKTQDLDQPGWLTLSEFELKQ